MISTLRRSRAVRLSVCLSLIGCDELAIERILLTCSDLIEIREGIFTVQLLRVLFQEISPEKIF